MSTRNHNIKLRMEANVNDTHIYFVLYNFTFWFLSYVTIMLNIKINLVLFEHKRDVLIFMASAIIYRYLQAILLSILFLRIVSKINIWSQRIKGKLLTFALSNSWILSLSKELSDPSCSVNWGKNVFFFKIKGIIWWWKYGA